ncbi:hypothetical protein G647_07274 [Cladophialophora carrionii CBS 160.54]|uniref:7-alpha-hydroxysteroid dehydrogenase n=1 Tax=Cladophialophora carrionii CBS 160.54 TaxID=1279043 RepID=V9D2T8_9EURO|nr:uncharacterized protein G647_07274 [Cladophialophora carrionii CBS 160.54]ETI20931.1 hypothetical protein G647_07274 [Cladophialophora carrionii CBS 160.54]
MSSQKAWAVIAGVGAGTANTHANHSGASVARRFAKHYAVALLARNPDNYEPIAKEINAAGGKAIGISTDASDSKSVKAAFEQLEKEFGGAPLAAAIYNVGGKFIRKPFLELSEDEFEAGWAANGRGAFLFSREVLPLMLKNTDAEYPPTLIFTSATAAMKGSANCASFASGKFAMRALAQSLAREFGPKGIHVNHAIIDGVIDIERFAHYKLDHPEAKIKPEAIADAYWYLHTQPRTCFTNEIDIRPAVEKW